MGDATGAVLVLNSGSSSLKYQLVHPDSAEVLASGLVERIGSSDAAAEHDQGGQTRTFDGAIADVRQGARLSDALSKRAFLPAHVTQMLRVGEESGRLADSASRIAGFYEAKLDASLKRLVAVLGPVLMIGVALLIAWLIVSVMTALTSINDLLV